LKECPFLGICDKRITREHFKKFCRVRIGLFINFFDCPYFEEFYFKKYGTKGHPKRPVKWKFEEELTK